MTSDLLVKSSDLIASGRAIPLAAAMSSSAFAKSLFFEMSICNSPTEIPLAPLRTTAIRFGFPPSGVELPSALLRNSRIVAATFGFTRKGAILGHCTVLSGV
jgi:hypothetical protein